MKLIACDYCGAVVQLRRAIRQCDCGMINGHYIEDDLHVEIDTGDHRKTRVIGLPNSLRRGIVTEAEAWVFAWDNERIILSSSSLPLVKHKKEE